MIPKFLKPFEKSLERYERKIIRIVAIPNEELPLEDKINLKTSKFLGLPFFSLEKEYPNDKKGKPMIIVAQLNFEEIPTIESFPQDGILQLFLSPTEWYDEDSRIIYHSKEELKEAVMDDFSFLSIDDYDEIPICRIHNLTFEKSIDRGGSEDCQFDYDFDQDDYWEFKDGLTENQSEEFDKYFDAAGHEIGGCAEFTQSNPRDYDSKKRNDVQLLQIDVDDFIMFGDNGLGHVFIDVESLALKGFSKAYFYWDCC
jgi:uncharacterized protein YwqG